MASQCRQNYHSDCEAGVNKQINLELYASYVYQSMYFHFDRDDIALPGFAKFFNDSSKEEREHAELLMKFQNQRGGRIVLQDIKAWAGMDPISGEPPDKKPRMEQGFASDHSASGSLQRPEQDSWGSGLEAMQAALALEKNVNQSLLDLHTTANNHNDAQMADFIENHYLTEQVEAIKQLGDYVTNLKRVGPGMGEYLFDKHTLSSS